MSGLRIECIHTENLPEFIESYAYRTFEFIPISPLRAKSYLANPHARPTDSVLYLGFIEDKLVAFRTVFPDIYYGHSGETRFVWLSGNWVHPNYRRSGYSTKLYSAIKTEWPHIAYTNYAPASGLLYTKTGDFTDIASKQGIRYYRRFSLAEILPAKSSLLTGLKPVLRLLDKFINLGHDIRLRQAKLFKNSDLFTSVSQLKLEVWSFIRDNVENAAFRRNKRAWDWILEFPWVSNQLQDEEVQPRYPFSVWSADFSSELFVCRSANGKINGLCWIYIRNGNLKIPYSFFNPEDAGLIAEFIRYIAAKHAVKTITVYDLQLNEALVRFNKFYWYRKQIYQKFYANFQLAEIMDLRQRFEPNPGDGDGVFT